MRDVASNLTIDKMLLTENLFPILGCIEDNILTSKLQEFLDRQIPNKEEQKDILTSFPFFVNKRLRINYVSKSIHKKLLNTSNFINSKNLLKGSPTATGLLLLPETIYPDFTNIPDYIDADPINYPINSILYSWLSIDEHDKISNEYKIKDLKRRISEGETPPKGANWNMLIEKLKNEEGWDNDQDRELLILPIYDNGTTQATYQKELINNDEIYGWEYNAQEGRSWYGKIHDYVMSYILFYNYTQTEFNVDKLQRESVNDEIIINTNSNDIEIIESNYFTKYQ